MPIITSTPGYQNGSEFEIWLALDNGQRLVIVDQAGPFSYTWAANNDGYFSIPLPVGFDKSLLIKDRRIYIWRKPVGGALALDFEGFLRRIVTSTDANGNTSRLIEGPGLNYLLSGRYAAFPDANTNVDSTATPVAADDLLKAIVRTNLGSTATTGTGRKASGVINAAYFGVAANLTLGPTISKAFGYRNVLDTLREICDASRTAGTELFFEIVPAIEDGIQHTVEFRTYTTQPGKDRTADSAGGGLTFGLDFGNMAEPTLVEDALDEVNRVYGIGTGQGSVRGIATSDDTTRQNASIWALREGTSPGQMSLTSTSGSWADVADAALVNGRPKTTLTCKLLSVPSYIYGLDWWRGDRVTVTYDGRQGDALVRAVTISVDANGYETIDAMVETYLV